MFTLSHKTPLKDNTKTGHTFTINSVWFDMLLPLKPRTQHWVSDQHRQKMLNQTSEIKKREKIGDGLKRGEVKQGVLGHVMTTVAKWWAVKRGKRVRRVEILHSAWKCLHVYTSDICLYLERETIISHSSIHEKVYLEETYIFQWLLVIFVRKLLRLQNSTISPFKLPFLKGKELRMRAGTGTCLIILKQITW